MEILRPSSFSGLTGLIAGFTTRVSGASPPPWQGLNLSFDVGDTRKNVERNRKMVLDHLGWRGALVLPRQVHGSEVLEIDEPVEPGSLEGDALFSQTPNILLGILVADCVPLLLAAAQGTAVGCVHAGWRGTAQGIAGKAIEEIGSSLRIDPGDLFVAIGPCIGPCCYEVDEPVVRAVSLACPGGLPASRTVDLQEANRRQLIAAGVRPDRIEILRLCTACRPDLFFSYRRDSGRTGRIMAFIGMARQG